MVVTKALIPQNAAFIYLSGEISGLGGLVAGFITSRLGVPLSAKVGLLCGGFGCLLIGVAQDFTMVQLGAVLMGLGNVWLPVIWGTMVAERFQEVRQRVFAALTLSNKS